MLRGPLSLHPNSASCIYLGNLLLYYKLLRGVAGPLQVSLSRRLCA